MNFQPGYILLPAKTYYFIVSANSVSSNQASVYTSNSNPAGQHPGGTLYYYNAGNGVYDQAPLDDLDFHINSLVNSPGWKNLY
jgi:hypothetical protein